MAAATRPRRCGEMGRRCLRLLLSPLLLPWKGQERDGLHAVAMARGCRWLSLWGGEDGVRGTPRPARATSTRKFCCDGSAAPLHINICINKEKKRV